MMHTSSGLNADWKVGGPVFLFEKRYNAYEFYIVLKLNTQPTRLPLPATYKNII